MMTDTPICVTDAQTFVNHIHEIKKWIYFGHLRLVVPSSMYENVAQLHQKTVEAKVPSQDNSRAKSAGRTKKEFPLFDINPKLARECLDRIKSRRGEDKSERDQPACTEEDRLEAISFQREGEEYSPWKGVDFEEEDEKATEDRPLSWAELAKKKLSQGNGVAEKGQGPKAPAKPKLVSKATGDNASPWKIQRNAPNVPVVEVPRAFRGFMSHALWRLHESIDRNDSNQIFILSDDERVQKAAKKLNIVARTTKDVRDRIQADAEVIDLNVMGALERDGLAKPTKDSKSNGENVAAQVGSTSVTDPDGTPTAVPGANEEPMSADDRGKAEDCSDAGTEVEKSGGETRNAQEKTFGFEPGEEKPAMITAPIVENHARDEDHEFPHIPSHDTEAGAKDTQPQVQLPIPVSPAGPTIASATFDPRHTDKTSNNRNGDPLHRVTSQQDAKESRQSDEPEDSDEEIVVFKPNPKRMSAHKKAVQIDPKPLALKGSLQPSLMEVSRQTSKVPKNLPQKDSVPSVKNVKTSDAAQNTRAASFGPTVIDPNAFGRGFAVNPDTSPHGGTRRPRSRQSPHNSYPHAQLNGTGNANDINGMHMGQHVKTSPARNASSRSPRPPPRVPKSVPINVQPHEIPVISHQAYTRAPLVAPTSQGFRQIRTSPGNNASVLPNGGAAPRTRESEADTNISDQRPGRLHGQRSVNALRTNPRGDAPHRSSHTPMLPQGSPNHAPQVQQQKTVKPALFESASDNTTLSRPPSSDFKTAMADVNYVLKSGTTREAARGKGKLWVG